MSWTQVSISGNWKDIALSKTGQYGISNNAGTVIRITSNSGLNWTSVKTGSTSLGTAVGVAITTDTSTTQTTYVLYTDGKISRSNNNGIAGSWSEIIDIASSGSFTSIACSPDGLKYYVSSSVGEIFIDGILKYTIPDIGKNISSISCSSDGKIIAACVNGGFIYISTNSGTNWTKRATSLNWRSIKIAYSPILVGGNPVILACAYNNFIWYSVDAGVNWISYSTTPGGGNWTSIDCDEFGTGIIASNFSYHIWTFTNDTWNFRENLRNWNCVACSRDVTSVDSVSYPKILLAGVDVGYMYQSTNGGVSCFVKGTKILSHINNEDIEINIENLKMGDLIKISTGEYKKIHFIGYNFIDNQKHQEYIKVLPKDSVSPNVPNENLYIISGHSLLFENIDYVNDDYTPDIYNNNIKPYYKVLASQCSLCSTIIYENNMVTYYHLSLENDDKDGQYGIYSQNMLSETMSINYGEKNIFFS